MESADRLDCCRRWTDELQGRIEEILFLADDQSLERRKTREGYLLRGEGRFMGGAGNWHRFDFRCIFDGTDVELRWKQYGKEVDE